MDPELKEQIIEECRRKCTCPCYQDVRQQRRCQNQDKDEYEGDQRTFLTFVTETISVIAFLIFGSVVFWLAVGGILFDFFKKLYYADRYVKIFIAGLFGLLLLSMTVRVMLNRRACRLAVLREQEKNSKVTIKVEPPKPPVEYLSVTFKDKSLQKKKNGNPNPTGDDKNDKVITKKFTVTITDEKKKEVYKESKIFFIPEMAMEMKKPPAVIVYLKNLILEDY